MKTRRTMRMAGAREMVPRIMRAMAQPGSFFFGVEARSSGCLERAIRFIIGTMIEPVITRIQRTIKRRAKKSGRPLSAAKMMRIVTKPRATVAKVVAQRKLLTFFSRGLMRRKTERKKVRVIAVLAAARRRKTIWSE